MFWCLVRLSTGALCGGLYANPLEMAVQSAVACSEAKDDGLLVSRQLMERVLVWVVSFSLAVEDGFLLLWIRVLQMSQRGVHFFLKFRHGTGMCPNSNKRSLGV